MRAVLRTLAQCHSYHILHRDIKPGKNYPAVNVLMFYSATNCILFSYLDANFTGCFVVAGNFMLLSEDDRAPLKAIDFGLAVPYDPECLPATDLGLEGELLFFYMIANAYVLCLWIITRCSGTIMQGLPGIWHLKF